METNPSEDSNKQILVDVILYIAGLIVGKIISTDMDIPQAIGLTFLSGALVLFITREIIGTPVFFAYNSTLVFDNEVNTKKAWKKLISIDYANHFFSNPNTKHNKARSSIRLGLFLTDNMIKVYHTNPSFFDVLNECLEDIKPTKQATFKISIISAYLHLFIRQFKGWTFISTPTNASGFWVSGHKMIELTCDDKKFESATQTLIRIIEKKCGMKTKVKENGIVHLNMEKEGERLIRIHVASNEGFLDISYDYQEEGKIEAGVNSASGFEDFFNHFMDGILEFINYLKKENISYIEKRNRILEAWGDKVEGNSVFEIMFREGRRGK